MQSAELDQVAVDVIDGKGQILHATGSIVAFDGFLKLYREDTDEDSLGDLGRRQPMLPPMAVKDPLKRNSRRQPALHQPPPRYSEASLVKKLEDWVSAGPPPTRRSCRCCRTANTCGWRSGGSSGGSRPAVTAFLVSFFDTTSYRLYRRAGEKLDDVSRRHVELARCDAGVLEVSPRRWIRPRT